MSNVVQNLKDSLIKDFKNADEVWFAVALITSNALNSLQNELSDETIQHYLIGIDLPTEPKALRTLHKLEIKDRIATRIYTEKEFFHPKVYVVRKGKKYEAYIGSANCTINGLSNNIEVSYSTDNQNDCKDLVVWFNSLNEVSTPLKESFLKEYEASFEKRKERKRKDEKEANKLKRKLEEEHQVSMTARKELIKVLKLYRKQKDYTKNKNKRDRDIQELRESLDYPTFKNIDVDKFFSLWELGHLISIPIPTIKREITKFRKVLRFLCDDSLDVGTRYNEVLSGSLKIRGVGEATISKILTIHDASKYAVRNDKINSVLTDYGIEIPKRISAGEKYKAVNNFLVELSQEAKMDNLAILDLYLYIEAND